MTAAFAMALRLAEESCAVFPCGKNKIPWTAKGVYSASSDPEEIAVMLWGPHAYCGVATGAVSGIDVLDIDVRPGPLSLEGQEGFSCGVDGFASLAKLGLVLPQTRTARTPSGGMHFWFRHIEGSRSRVLARGVEWFSNKKFVMVPPAPNRHWLRLGDIADAPEALVRLVLGRKQSTHHAQQGELSGLLVTADRTLPPSTLLPKPIYFRLLRLCPTPPATNKQQRWLRELLRVVAGKREGRNEALNWGAFKMREMIAAGWLTRAAAVELLTLASRANGYFAKDGAEAVLATLESGLGPIKLPWHRPIVRDITGIAILGELT